MAVLKMTIGKEGRSIQQFYRYLTQESKTKTGLISALNCRLNCIPKDMMLTKNLYQKIEGRQFYDLIQTFDIGENISAEKAHALGVELAQKTFGNMYECAVVTHIDKGYIHNHILVNSVSFMSGRKFSNKRSDLFQIRKVNESILKRENLLTIKELKKQNRSFRQIKKEEKYLSERCITDKSYIVSEVNKNIKRSGSMPEFIRRMKNSGIEIKFTQRADGEIYYNYNGISYTHKSLGAAFSFDEVINRFSKKQSHIDRISGAIVDAKAAAVSYEDFLAKLKETKYMTVNIRGDKTISIQYGKRKPVRIDHLGYRPEDLKNYFTNKNTYTELSNKLKDIVIKNKELDNIKLLNYLQENNIINGFSNDFKYLYLDNKKILFDYLLSDLRTNFKENPSNKLVNEICKTTFKINKLEDLKTLYKISIISVGKDYLFIKDNNSCTIEKDKIDRLINENNTRKDIYAALKKSTSLDMFISLAGLEKVKDEAENIFFTKDGKEISYYGNKNSYGNNTFTYTEIAKKINDNLNYKYNIDTFRSEVRKDLINNMKSCSSIQEFYYKVNSKYQTKEHDGNLYIYDPELKAYCDLKEFAGKNGAANRLSQENIEKAVTSSNGTREFTAIRNSFIEDSIYEISKVLFSPAKKNNNELFSENYYRKIREKEERKNNLQI